MSDNKKKAVFFDAAKTLFYPYPSVGEIYASLAGKYGMETDAERLGEIFYQEHMKREQMNPLETTGGVQEEKRWYKELVRDVFPG
ncbi:MAG: hypothetical protein ACLFQB_14785 [Chitinispirillaceae bacterium]